MHVYSQDGESPLTKARQKGHEGCVKLLLEAKAATWLCVWLRDVAVCRANSCIEEYHCRCRCLLGTLGYFGCIQPVQRHSTSPNGGSFWSMSYIGVVNRLNHSSSWECFLQKLQRMIWAGKFDSSLDSGIFLVVRNTHNQLYKPAWGLESIA